MNKYVVSIRGKLPEDIAKKISALHASVIQKVREARPSTPRTSPARQGEVISLLHAQPTSLSTDRYRTDVGDSILLSDGGEKQAKPQETEERISND